MKTRINNKGFSLIEVMIALVVLAVGILGISKLQGTLIRSASDANQRTVAASIAQQKIDDLKSFVNLSSALTWDGALADASPATALAYAHITGADHDADGYTGTGGEMLEGSVSVGNYTYELSWLATDYYYTDPNDYSVARTAAQIIADGDTVPASSNYKVVTVNVDWTDEVNATQTIALSTVIDAYQPSFTALADDSNEGGGLPKASYLPEAAPDVIDIHVDTGNGHYRQTSKPLPDAVKTGADANTIVSFEVVTYHQDGSDFFADINEEFVTVDCKCQFSTSLGTTFPPGHVVWDETKDNRYDYVGPLVSKQTATQTGNANAAEELCATCCRDHHDADASPVKYVSGTVSGNHVHYQADGTTIAVQADGDEYVESCRFKRIDGILRVFQDWNLYDMTSMSRAALADGQPLQTTYSSYVANYIIDEVAGTSTATKPDADTDIVITVGSAMQLENRGTYIDQVYDLTGSVNPTAYTDYMADATNLDRLEKVPFAEVNLSLLAHWTSDDDTKVTVTDEDVATIADPATNYYGTYSRGWIDALDLAAAPGVPVMATISDNNNGFTQVVDASNAYVSDAVDVEITAGGSPITISGTYAITFPLGNPGAPTISPSSNCSLPGGNTYTCSFTAPWTGTVQINVAVTTGPPAQRCSGSSVAFAGSGLSVNTTHDFASFACN